MPRVSVVEASENTESVGLKCTVFIANKLKQPQELNQQKKIYCKHNAEMLPENKHKKKIWIIKWLYECSAF